MAQVAEGDIRAGGSRSVGRVRVDPGLIWGEAGPLEPRLVIPVSIEMFNRPAEQMLALLHLTAFLHLDISTNPTTQIGSPARASLLSGFPVRSLPEGSVPHQVQLRFALTPGTVYHLEAVRHAVPEEAFQLYVRLQGPLAWLPATRGEVLPAGGRAGKVIENDPFQGQLGPHSELSLLWTSGIDDLRVQIDPSVWINKVLPGLGVDNLRLVDVGFPPGLPEVSNAAKAFTEAQDAYYGRRYVECISKCRAIIRAWNKKLVATSRQHLAELVADAQGWAADDPRRKLLDAIWQALLDAANMASHPEGQILSYQPTAHDAKLSLMMTATISEYLYRLVV